MTISSTTDQEFIRLWQVHGTPTEVAKATGLTLRTVYNKRREVERRNGIELLSEIAVGSRPTILMPENQIRATMNMENGTILVASDCHYLPNEVSAAHKGFVQAIKKYKPSMVLLNGDIFDFASISRHPALNTRPQPSLRDEIEAVKDRVGEIEKVAGNAVLFRTLGNHDARLEIRIANNSPEFAGLLSLEQFLPRWKASVSLMVNSNLMFLHKWHSGIHSSYNNVLKSGTSIVTGHTHKLNVRPYTDYNGTRFGIETGTLADPESDAFEYCMDTPKDWVSGFVMLTIKNHQLLYPEFGQVVNGKVFFRGEFLG